MRPFLSLGDVEDLLEDVLIVGWIRDLDIAYSHCHQAASNSSDVETVFERMIIGEYCFVMMHVMCSTTIFNPYTIDSSNLVIDGCFAAIRETAEDCTVSWSGFVGVCDVSRLLWFLWFSTTATFAFPFRLLLPFGLFGEVFFDNALVTFF